MSARMILVGAVLVVTAAASANGDGDQAARDAVRAVHEAAIASPDDPTTQEALAKVAPYLAELDAYVFEGDRLVKRSRLQEYLRARHDRREAVATAEGRRDHSRDPRWLALLQSPELKVNYNAGHPDVWSREKLPKLTYAVDRASFGADATQYERVVKNVGLAAKGWQDLCPACGIRFMHVTEADAAPTFDLALVIVRRYDAEGKFIAEAPFPSTPADERFLYVDPSYFATDFDPVGIFRHELGHVLGYRHEQLDERSGCYQIEDNEWESLSRYDPRSVMHYFCGGHGTMSLAFTATDKTSHRKLYTP
jgi:hypothetical protein